MFLLGIRLSSSKNSAFLFFGNDANGNQYTQYVEKEQPNTIIDLSERIKPYDNEKNNEIIGNVIYIDHYGNVITNIKKHII